MIRVGLMGCGTVAGYGHLPAIMQTPGLQLVALYDPNPAALRKAQDQCRVPQAYGAAAAFFESGIDAVAITSPAPYHCENVLAAARYGKHVLCEKPLASDEHECARMIRAMADAHCQLYVGFTYRFSPTALEIHRQVRAGAVGEVLSLRLIYNWDCHGKYSVDAAGRRVIQKRREDRMLEGGPMIDCGTHQIDLARWWLGAEVVSFAGHGAWVDNYEAPDHVWLHLEHANGAHTMVEISYSYGHTAQCPRHEFVYELIGTRGVLRFDREAQRFELIGESGTTDLGAQSEKNFAGMYAEFAQALARGGSDLLASGQDGLAAVRISRLGTLDAVRRRLPQS